MRRMRTRLLLIGTLSVCLIPGRDGAQAQNASNDREALPAPFKELVQVMRLSPHGVSKYRLCREAWGVPSPLREVADA